MSQPYTPRIAPMLAADFKAVWIADVRALLQREGMAARAGDYLAPKAGELVGEHAIWVIEVQSTNTGVWHPLNLPANTTLFASAADRDAVLAQLWRAPK